MSSWTREISLSARTKVIDRGDQRHGFESASSDSEGECREASEGSTVADSASNGSTRRHRYAAPQAPRRRGSLGTLTDRVAAEPARRFGSGRVNSRSFLGHNGSADDPTLQFDTLDLNVIAGLDAVTRALLEVGRWRRDDGAFLEDIRHVRTHPRTRLDLAGERDRLRSWRWRRRWRRSWGYRCGWYRRGRCRSRGCRSRGCRSRGCRSRGCRSGWCRSGRCWRWRRWRWSWCGRHRRGTSLRERELLARYRRPCRPFGSRIGRDRDSYGLGPLAALGTWRRPRGIGTRRP